MQQTIKENEIIKFEHDVLMDISNVENYTNRNVTNEKIYFSEFVQRLSSPLITKRKGSAGGFIGGWVQDERKNENVLTRSMITIDIDDGMGTTKVWDHVEGYTNFACVMYSTHNSTFYKPRYRLLIPLKQPIKAERYKQVTQYLVHAMDLKVDHMSFTLSQLMNYPTCEDELQYEFYYRDLPLFDANDVPKDFEEETEKIQSEKRKHNYEPSPTLKDDEVVKIATNAKNGDKVKALFSGDISDYGSQSEADQALCNLIAFYTQDYEQIDRIFTSSGLYRDKWDREDYKTNTIDNAIHGLTSTYQKQDFKLLLNEQGDNEYVIPTPFVVHKGELFHVKPAKKEGQEDEIIYISRHTPYVTKELHNIERPQVLYQVEWNDRTGKTKEVVPATVIQDATKLIELSEKGFSVTTNNRRNLINFLDSFIRYNEKSITLQKAVERLGNIKGYFIHPVTTEDIKIVALDDGEKQLLESFKTKGTIESWRSEVLNRIHDQPKALLMVLASFTSVIIKDLNIEPFIVDLSGTTSTGKSTTLKLATSVWGTSGLMSEWNATRVAIERKAAFLNSFPLILDDTRKANQHILQDIIYQFSGGRAKGRGSVKGSQRESTWNNIMLSTGEVSINDYAESAGGVAARVIPITDQPLKKDHENVMALLRGVENNYGVVGIEFLKAWIGNKKDFIPQYNQIRNYYLEKASGNEVLTRISNYYAAIHFTGSILNHQLNFNIDLQNIEDLFDEIAEENKSIDKPLQFLETILTDLDSSRNDIYYDYEPKQSIKAIYKSNQLYLLISYVNEMLGVESNTIRKEWLKRGISIENFVNGKRVDYRQTKHKGTNFRVILINMDYVEKLGFNFNIDS